MKTVIDAIINLIQNPVFNVSDVNTGNNRINMVGDGLEYYIKSLFSGEDDINTVFSYTGNSSNPPDIMIKGGDAIEVKKVTNHNSAIALNSSFPKQIIKNNDPMISKQCRLAEDWEKKDMIYAIGAVKNQKLTHLTFIYGKNYAAPSYVYENIKNKIKEGVEGIPGVEFTETRELGKIKNLDPSGATDLRVRGMWHIQSPWKLFKEVYQPKGRAFEFFSIIDDEKWEQLPRTEELLELSKTIDGLEISDIEIQSTEDQMTRIGAKLITYGID